MRNRAGRDRRKEPAGAAHPCGTDSLAGGRSGGAIDGTERDDQELDWARLTRGRAGMTRGATSAVAVLYEVCVRELKR